MALNQAQIFAIRETLKLYRADKQKLVGRRENCNSRIAEEQAEKEGLNEKIDEINLMITALQEGIIE